MNKTNHNKHNLQRVQIHDGRARENIGMEGESVGTDKTRASALPARTQFHERRATYEHRRHRNRDSREQKGNYIRAVQTFDR